MDTSELSLIYTHESLAITTLSCSAELEDLEQLFAHAKASRFRETETSTIGPSIDEVEITDNSTLLRVRGKALSLSNDLLKDYGGARHLSIEAAWASPESCILGLAGKFVWSYPVVRFDASDTGKFAWQTWISPVRHRVGGATGTGIAHWFEIKIVDERVYIFGGGPHTVYLECLSLEDGALLFHFTTDIT